MGDGDAVPDAGRQHLLPLQHGGEQRFERVDPGAVSEQLGQLAEDAGLVGGREGHPDAIGGEQFGEQQVRSLGKVSET